MELGRFSISLNVKDIEVSKQFYQNLGFDIVAGDQAQNWLIMQNGEAKIGLFQGMFEQNIITFNPKDIAPVHQKLDEMGVDYSRQMGGQDFPKMAMFKDPDGNNILVDQHDN
ncbi:VOC family protein [Maritalea mediterranea]|uniref:VOC family protein n=1 Tax=Maritalea mediterranea TaxID=2909667 RepID=A0ABS9E798_9HYPH|nr:VOC family protein [Maritalea mediterranea]MCF4097308.1 VOC family protein [Maritalea mediterranea]